MFYSKIENIADLIASMHKLTQKEIRSGDIKRVPLLVSGFRAAFGGPLLNEVVLLCMCIRYMYICDSYFWWIYGIIDVLMWAIIIVNCINVFAIVILLRNKENNNNNNN